MRVTHTVLVAASVSVALGGGETFNQDPSQRATFRAGTDVVTIDVAVRHRNTPAAGLTASDFEVRDNGIQQRIELLSNEAVPADVSIILNIRIAQVGRLRSSLTSDLASIARWLRPIDRVRLIAFGRDVRVVVPMQAANSWQNGRLPEDALAKAESLLKSDERDVGLHALFDALLIAMSTPPEPGRRHLIIPFSFRSDTSSVMFDSALLQAVAARTDALLHVALWGGRTEGLPAGSLQTVYTTAALTSAAEATGGTVHEVGSGGVGGFKPIFEDFRSGYVLQYTLTGVPPGGWHEVTVRLPKHPDYTVRARKGYVGR